MKKNKRYIFLILLLMLIFATSYYSMNKQEKPKDDKKQNTQLVSAEAEKIPLTRKQYELNFDKTTNSFTSEAVEVSKDKTENKMTVVFDDKVKDEVSFKIYQDGKLIKELKKEADNSIYIIPFKLDNDKSSFKLEIDYLLPLGENEKFNSTVIWYVNKSI